ncbi:MAG: hypothetical protein ISP32_02195 [Thermoleophilia bacterium]|nr:hypothetical protein [Thermoleophilia bacterium]
MPACTPPPPPVHAIVRQATALVSARVAPIATPTACMSSDIPAGSGMATPGVVWLPAADAAMLARPPRQWSPDRLTALLHEVLHQVGMERGLEEGGHMSVEEGAVEAVTHDLRPAWLKRIMGRNRAVAVAYPQWVASVRRASAVATQRPWKSSAARAWRARLVATPPLQRTLV